MEDSSNSAQIDLEIQVTYLENTVNELNNIVYQQQKSIDKLQSELKDLVAKIEDLEDSSGEDLPHVKPPHY